LIPSDFPPWGTVYSYFRVWSKNGLLQIAHDILREKVRTKAGKEPTPSLLIVDSQCVQTTMIASEEKGLNGGKHVKGRKRNIAVDTLGLIWALYVSAANVSEQEAGFCCLTRLHTNLKRLVKILFDAGYQGEWFKDLVEMMFNCTMEIVHKLVGQVGFVVQKKRWIVERTFAWFFGYRRLSKDYERYPIYSETMIQICMIRIMLRRLNC